MALCPYSGHILVFGESRKFCVALITLDPDALWDWANQHGLGGKSYADLVKDAVRDMVGEYVAKLNAELNRWETIKKWQLFDHELSIENGELTPSLKVKRSVVEKQNQHLLDSLYS